MEYTTPRTIAIVTESEYLGRKVAVSVPLTPRDAEPDTDFRFVGFSLHDVRMAQKEEEDRYRKLEPKGQHEVQIDLEALRSKAAHAVLVGDVTWDEIGAECGWTREDAEYEGGRRGDGQKVRTLLSADSRDLTYDEANALVKAIGADPVDVGL